MALSRAAGLCRLALRAQWTTTRLLSAVAAGDAPSGGDSEPGRSTDLAALRRERALRPPAERTQPAPPRKLRSTSTPSYEQLQLNKDIQACTSAEAVLDLATACSALWNGVIVATALMRIAKVTGKGEPTQRPESDARFQQLLAAAVLLMERKEVDAYGFANLLYACGQLRILPPDNWLESFWRASGPKLGEFTTQGLSNTFYACGQLGITPPPFWSRRFWDASALKLEDLIAQGLSIPLHTCS